MNQYRITQPEMMQGRIVKTVSYDPQAGHLKITFEDGAYIDIVGGYTGYITTLEFRK